MRTAALIATGDPVLLDDLLRLAAAADVAAEVVRDADHARGVWRHPPLVLVGPDVAAELTRGAVPRRPGVTLVTTDQGDADVYRRAVEIGAQDVAVLPAAETWLVEALAAAADPGGERAVTVCVTGGRGGAGASTLSAALGLAGMRHGLRVLLVDADPLGGGLDLALGREQIPGARWPELVELRGQLSSTALRESLPSLGGTVPGGELAVLSAHRRDDAGSIPAAAIRTVLDAGGRGFDLVVVDLPRSLGPVAAEALLMADVTFLVVPAEVRSAVAADRVAAAVHRHMSDVRVVVRGPAPGGLTAAAIAQALGLPLAGTVRSDQRLAVALEHGDLLTALPRSSLADLCTRLIRDLREAA